MSSFAIVVTAALTLAAAPPSQPAEPPAEQGPTCDRIVASIDDGFRVQSRDCAFGVRVGFLSQFRYQAVAHTGGTESGFEVRLARPVLSTTLWQGLVATRLMPEFASGRAVLLDASVTVTAHEAFALQFGQYRPWLSRGYRIGLPFQALPERGPVVDTFRVNRDVGFTVLGRPWGGRLEYYAGVMNGAGPGSTAISRSPLLTARVVVAPLGPVAYSQTPSPSGDAPLRIAMGGNAYTVAATDTPDPDPTGVTPPPRRTREVGTSADLVVSRWRLRGLAEGFWRHRVPTDALATTSWGAYGQVAALLVASRLDVAFRAGALDDGARVHASIESGLNIYLHGNHAKVQLSYACDHTLGATGCAEHGVVAQLQLSL